MIDRKWIGILLFFFILLHTLSITTAPEIEWSKTFGGPDADCGHSVQQTEDGGYIIVGSTTSYGPGYSAIWLIKTDSKGNEEWNRTFGSYGSWGRSVQQTEDGGYVIVGDKQSSESAWGDIWLIKTDSKGNEEWNITFGGSDPQELDMSFSVQQTSDGGYIIVGDRLPHGEDSSIWLIKTDSKGNEEWNRTFGGSKGSTGYSAQQTSDEGYILTGVTNTSGEPEIVWLIKTDSQGKEEWNRTFGGLNNWGCGYSVQQTKDGGYIVAGFVARFLIPLENIREKEEPSMEDVGVDVWLIKTDSKGNEQWNMTFGGEKNDEAYAVQQTDDGGYIITGSTGIVESFEWRSEDVLLIKTDSKGNEEWNMTFGGEKNDGAYAVLQTSDGGYVVVGYTESYGSGKGDVWLIKIKGS